MPCPGVQPCAETSAWRGWPGKLPLPEWEREGTTKPQLVMLMRHPFIKHFIFFSASKRYQFTVE